jgi:hypothetical protein
MESAANQPDDFSDRPTTAPARQVSYDGQDLKEWRVALNHPAMVVALRLARLVVRGIALFVFSFIEIMAELLAPIALIVGLGWAALPGLLAMAGNSPQARELLGSVVQSVPGELHVGGMVLTPTALIVDGLILIAVVALCRTMQTIVSSEI